MNLDRLLWVLVGLTVIFAIAMGLLGRSAEGTPPTQWCDTIQIFDRSTNVAVFCSANGEKIYILFHNRIPVGLFVASQLRR